MRLRSLIMALTCAFLAGCGTSKPFEVWQQHVETYVSINGNGDIMCLRNTDPDAPRPVFEAQKGNTLAHGVLVGCEEADSRLWWVYVVGASHDGDLRDVQVLAVTERDEQLVFASSPVDAPATAQYISYRKGMWRTYRTDQPDEKDFIAPFPGPADVFTIEMTGATAAVTEQNSGAKWTVSLAQQLSAAQ